MNPPGARFRLAFVADALARRGMLVCLGMLMCLTVLGACSRAPNLTGVLVYADTSGRVVARDLALRQTRTLATDGADGDLAVDRRGQRIVYAASGSDGARALIVRHLVTESAEALCQSGYPGVPVAWRDPTFSASGDEVVFTTLDAAGGRAAHLAKGSRHCARIAAGIESAEFGPGVDRVLLADERALAAYSVADALAPAIPPGVALPPIWRSDEPIVDLAVDRLYEKYAALTPTRLVVRGFAGPSRESGIDFAVSRRDEVTRDPAALAFSPDGGLLAVVFGPRDGARMRVFEIARPGDPLVDRGEIPLDPAPIPARFAWVPLLLSADQPESN